MRLWHQQLIPLLPRQQLLGQHRECCALRGRGWGRKHKTVDYVFNYSPLRLYMYHKLVMQEMLKRGYNPAEEWFNCKYRGKKCEQYKAEIKKEYNSLKSNIQETIYPEHNARYLEECIDNLMAKGVNCKYLQKYLSENINIE